MGRSQHTPAASGGKWIRGSTRWAIYYRDDFACVYCGRTARLSIDHVKPCENGGCNDASNLVTCCLSCNSSKQGVSARKWYARLRERGIDTEKMRHRIARLLRKPLDRKRGRFLSRTREPMKKPAIEDKALQALTDLADRNPFPQNIESIYVPRDLVTELVGWVHDSAAEHSRSDEDVEGALTEMAQRHGVPLQLLLDGAEAVEEPTNDTSADTEQGQL